MKLEIFSQCGEQIYMKTHNISMYENESLFSLLDLDFVVELYQVWIRLSILQFFVQELCNFGSKMVLSKLEIKLAS